ncbi:hypothetical protein MML48_5g00013775 [Holotrichia oblita]|uniref:Uncharacterized protein n=1 Tax=Holotrichia oblita TaxID=644536 RepID=A0ACB9T2R4_HOLOL|nr:hypothetical protein MML48_5g00013775 [Holotrichia oblita]
MPLTLDQEKFLLEAYFRSGERDPNGQWKYSTRSCINDLTTEFPDIDLDYESLSRHVLRTVERFRNTGSVAKGKSSGRRTVLNEEVVEDIRVRLDQSPRKPLRQLAQQTVTERQLLKKDAGSSQSTRTTEATTTSDCGRPAKLNLSIKCGRDRATCGTGRAWNKIVLTGRSIEIPDTSQPAALQNRSCACERRIFMRRTLAVP